MECQRVRLPFEILPTASILAAPYPSTMVATPSPIYSVSSSSEVKKSSLTSNHTRLPRELDEEQGKRVLALIYHRNGTIEKRTTPLHEVAVAHESTSGQARQSSFYLGNNNNGGAKREEQPAALDLVDRMNDMLGIQAKRSVRHIDRELLIENGITLEDLIKECGIGITDLKAAGIVTKVDSLIALNFKTTDLVHNRDLFRVQHLGDLFELTYTKLRKMKSIRFGAYDLLTCRFYPNELQQMGFSFDHLVQDRGINMQQLLSLNFSLQDLVELGLTPENLETLGIDRRIALDEFKWDRRTYAELTGQPMHNTRHRNAK